MSLDAEFLQTLLHDLGGPVARLRMLSELLRRRGVGADEESRQLLQHIGTSATSADEILTALRRYTDVVSLGYHPEPFDLAIAVSDAVGRVEYELGRSGGKVSYPGLPEVFGDRGLLAILFHELIKNSIRCRSQAPLEIEVSAVSDDARWRMLIKDNGGGIERRDLERIFRPFDKTADDSTPAIGLAICRYIAALHGGEIVAVPAQRGAAFLLTLPQ